MMKTRRAPLMLAAVAIAALASLRCGQAESPAAPQEPTAAAVTGDAGAANASSLPDVDSVAAIQSWSIQDACSDGKGIRARLWEAVGLRLTGRATRIFTTRSNLGTVRFRLQCVRGNNSCLGATTNPASAAVWGVGLNAERKPVKAFCRVCSTTAANLRLICTRRLDGGLDAQLVEDEFASAGSGELSQSSDSDEGLATFDAE